MEGKGEQENGGKRVVERLRKQEGRHRSRVEKDQRMKQIDRKSKIGDMKEG